MKHGTDFNKTETDWSFRVIPIQDGCHCKACQTEVCKINNYACWHLALNLKNKIKITAMGTYGGRRGLYLIGQEGYERENAVFSSKILPLMWFTAHFHTNLPVSFFSLFYIQIKGLISFIFTKKIPFVDIGSSHFCFLLNMERSKLPLSKKRIWKSPPSHKPAQLTLPTAQLPLHQMIS